MDSGRNQAMGIEPRRGSTLNRPRSGRTGPTLAIFFFEAGAGPRISPRVPIIRVSTFGRLPAEFVKNRQSFNKK